jgi:quinol monooxygenase YgiN
MVFVSVTRLRLGKLRHLPLLVWHSLASMAQVKRADGCLSSTATRTAGDVYWTITTWRDEQAMRAFMVTGAHLKAMPNLKHWCSEASVAHWHQESGPVTLADAQDRLAKEGRLSKVLHPSPAHAAGSTVG